MNIPEATRICFGCLRYLNMCFLMIECQPFLRFIGFAEMDEPEWCLIPTMSLEDYCFFFNRDFKSHLKICLSTLELREAFLLASSTLWCTLSATIQLSISKDFAVADTDLSEMFHNTSISNWSCSWPLVWPNESSLEGILRNRHISILVSWNGWWPHTQQFDVTVIPRLICVGLANLPAYGTLVHSSAFHIQSEFYLFSDFRVTKILWRGYVFTTASYIIYNLPLCSMSNKVCAGWLLVNTSVIDNLGVVEHNLSSSLLNLWTWNRSCLIANLKL